MAKDSIEKDVKYFNKTGEVPKPKDSISGQSDSDSKKWPEKRPKPEDVPGSGIAEDTGKKLEERRRHLERLLEETK